MSDNKPLKVHILDKLNTAKRNLIACNQNEDDVDLIILAFLDLLNRGDVEGEFKVRINGHVPSAPKVDGLKIRLGKVEHKIVMEEENGKTLSG